MLQACVNGSRTRADHPAMPVTADDIAQACAESVSVGATDLHVHPRDSDGRGTLVADVVAEAIGAVRQACPRTLVGVTTGAWAIGGDRRQAIRKWTMLPDHASANLHEPGAVTLAHALLERGIASTPVSSAPPTAATDCWRRTSARCAATCSSR